MTSYAAVSAWMKRSRYSFALLPVVAAMLLSGCAPTLVDLIAKGQDAAAQDRINKGDDVNAWGGNLGETPLLIAAAKGRVDMVKLLLSRGANPNIRSYDFDTGSTPLMAAVALWHPTKPSRRQSTPLMAAVANRQVEITRLLLERGAQVDAKVNLHVGVTWLQGWTLGQLAGDEG